ncbi:MAG TPA: geranylgeranyl reductase family protein [Vicinamibacterales bacterium]|nr:geranylgeranyl reductase family protein [Vicinamibacterales bacterium]
MQIPSTCDVLVIGAGPAGAAAACRLARTGLRVVLVDQHAFPRDKVCGDGLIGDALGALDTLGLSAAVAARAAHATALQVYAPGGRSVPLSGTFACIPRLELDALLVDAAAEAGASVAAPATAVGAVDEGGRVRGARIVAGRREQRVEAAFTLLATGANPHVLTAFGLDAPPRPDAVAGRAYFEVPPDLAARQAHLTIAYDRPWCPGYGWIFPGPGGRCNVGVGLFAASGRAPSLRASWNDFTTRFPPAAEIVRRGRQLSPFRGAPMRTGLRGAAFGRPGLLVIGEAAATTYPATGEGIGKALESALLAAGFVEAALGGRSPAESLHHRYGGEFRRRFSPRYSAYRIAQAWASSPLLLDVLAARAGEGTFVRSELEALIGEREGAGRLFSLRGLLAALVR